MIDRRTFLKLGGKASVAVPAMALGVDGHEPLEPIKPVEPYSPLTAEYLNGIVTRLNELSER